MPGQIHRAVPEVVVAGLRKTGAAPLLESVDLSWLQASGEGIPLDPYRAFLQTVLDAHGARPLLEAGQALPGLEAPLLYVFLNSDSPEVLIEKEARLGRFIHSRHQVRITESGTGRLILEHWSKVDAPMPTENLANCGIHVALLKLIGATGLTLRFPGGDAPDAVVYREGSFVEVAGTSGFELWRFDWDDFRPTREPMPGLDPILIDAARLRELEDRPGIAERVERVVREDLSRTWKLGTVAHRIGTSTRTLQRQLAAAGQTFSDLVLAIRTGEAARLLRETDLSTTVIGYACGFADTSHFNRSFKRRFRRSPGAWRRQPG